MEQNDQPKTDKDAHKGPKDKRLDSIGWGVFLIMTGGLWLAPEGLFPEGTWLIGTGIIILGLQVVRYLNGIKTSGFWIVLGIIALAFGISDVYAFDIPVFPILIILFGLSIILKPIFGKK
jgi:hypothetical protein